ncbi:di-trans,poly-cis-decaprenylcistransferase [Thermoplasmatales archaeon ex4484_36]|nr:MAG: di-trans,poly-cis-decaprenylcistransferase [Thermoplasmatales archaeon ex4484_36]
MTIEETLRETLKRAREERLKKLILSSNHVPRHVAIIMDGNRRFAQQLGLDPVEGYKRGKEKLEEVLSWCQELGIRVLTVYAFSMENFRRRPEEVKAILALIKEGLEELAEEERVYKYKVRVCVLGQRNLLPPDVKEVAERIEKLTEGHDQYFFNIAIAYGGREEIITAIKRICTDCIEGKISPEDIDEETVTQYLYTKGMPDPDLILRTSGEERISNFLLWQLAYSELYFADVYWPRLTKLDFLRAIRSYQLRQRRFGK